MNLFKHIISVKCSLIYDFCIGKASCFASKCVNKTNILVALAIEEFLQVFGSFSNTKFVIRSWKKRGGNYELTS